MNVQLENHIATLKATITTWELFRTEVLKLENNDVKERGLDNYKMVWTQNEVDYYFDPTTMGLIDFYVAQNAGIITDVRFSIPNYIIRKGILDCENYIETQITSLQKSIKSLEQNKASK
jgi:hypothetical protein